MSLDSSPLTASSMSSSSTPSPVPTRRHEDVGTDPYISMSNLDFAYHRPADSDEEMEVEEDRSQSPLDTVPSLVRRQMVAERELGIEPLLSPNSRGPLRPRRVTVDQPTPPPWAARDDHAAADLVGVDCLYERMYHIARRDIAEFGAQPFDCALQDYLVVHGDYSMALLVRDTQRRYNETAEAYRQGLLGNDNDTVSVAADETLPSQSSSSGHEEDEDIRVFHDDTVSMENEQENQREDELEDIRLIESNDHVMGEDDDADSYCQSHEVEAEDRAAATAAVAVEIGSVSANVTVDSDWQAILSTVTDTGEVEEVGLDGSNNDVTVPQCDQSNAEVVDDKRSAEVIAENNVSAQLVPSFTESLLGDKLQKVSRDTTAPLMPVSVSGETATDVGQESTGDRPLSLILAEMIDYTDAAEVIVETSGSGETTAKGRGDDALSTIGDMEALGPIQLASMVVDQ